VSSVSSVSPWRHAAVGWLLLGTWFALLVGALTWPVAVELDGPVLGEPRADTIKHLWTLWWALTTDGGLPTSTALLNAPTGAAMTIYEPLNAWLARAMPTREVTAVANLLVLINLLATGLAGAWLGRTLTGGWLGAWAAGSVLCGSSVVAWFVSLGVGELLHLWWIPATLGLAVHLRRRPHPALAILLGLSAGATLWSCFYYGLFLAIALPILALDALVEPEGRARRARAFLGAGAAAALAAAVVIAVYQSDQTSHARAMQIDEAVELPEDRLEVADLLLWRHRLTGTERGAYWGGRTIGYAVLFLAVWGALRRRREARPWLLIAAAAIVLAQGSYLAVGLADAELGGARIPLPYLLLNRALEALSVSAHFPARFLALAACAVCALVALGVRRSTAPLVIVALVETALLSQQSWPWARTELQSSAGLLALRDHAGHAMVDLDLAFDAHPERRRLSLGAQMAHHHPVSSTPLERVERANPEGAARIAALRLTPDVEALIERGALLRGDYRGDLVVLEDASFTELQIHTFGMDPETLRLLMGELSALLGAPLVAEPPTLVWELPRAALPPVQAQRKRTAHAERMAAILSNERLPWRETSVAGQRHRLPVEDSSAR